MTTLLTYQLADGIATITLDDNKANVLSFEMLEQMNEALDQALNDDAVVVITGRPGVFSGGFDLKVLRGGGADAARLLEDGFALALRLLEHPAPVVVACTGHAIAMGSFLLLCADYRIGVEGDFRVVAIEVAIGMVMPWTAIEICRQRLTPSHFYRAVNLAETYSPTGAVEAGFLDRTVASDQLESTTLEIAQGLGALDRHAHAATKLRTREQAVLAIQEGLEIDQVLFRQMSGLDE